MLTLHKNPPVDEWPGLFERPALDVRILMNNVETMLDQVKKDGDAAVLSLTAKYDNVSLTDLRVEESTMESAAEKVPDTLKNAINAAASNITAFHKTQAGQEIRVETMPGVACWRKSVPIEKVGLYIPGGTAPLFSTVLMLAIPARLAGCSEIVMCTPPDSKGDIHPAILYAARISGINHIYRAGGAQAIAAMAFGTESIPGVYKIFGPGNQYVTAAKQLVALSGTAIDMPAGPSEVAVIADSSAKPAFVAADLLSQAEHGRDSQVILFCTSESIYKAVHAELERQLTTLPRKEFALASLSNSRCIVTNDIDTAVQMSNAYAPEHLIIATENALQLAEKVTNAGSVFVGHLTPESAGDYASGTNHTLPTNGFARAYSGVSLDSFMKKITFQHITGEGLEQLGDIIEVMAEAEQLSAHANAVKIRRAFLS